MKVDFIGRAVAAKWIGKEWTGEVLAVLSSVIYLGGEQGEIYWIGSDTGVHDDRAFLVNGDLPKAVNSDAVQVRNQVIEIGLDSKIDFSGMKFTKPINYPLKIPSIAGMRVVYENFLKSLEMSRSSDLLMFVVRLILNDGETDPGETYSKSPLFYIDFMQKTIVDLVGAAHLNQIEDVYDIAAKLIGCGDGLTPVGDDFLGGFYFALENMKLTFPDIAGQEIFPNHYHECINEIAQNNTHRISAGLLAGFLNREAPYCLHYLFIGLLSPVKRIDLEKETDKVLKIGSSSGEGILAGFLLGIYIMLNYFSREPDYVG